MREEGEREERKNKKLEEEGRGGERRWRDERIQRADVKLGIM